MLGFEHEMEGKVRDQLVRTQRDQILRTQIRVLQNELGEAEDGDEDEIEVLPPGDPGAGAGRRRRNSTC